MSDIKEDIYIWIDFVLHDAEFLEAVRIVYTQEQIDAVIAEIIAWLQQWVKNKA